MTPTYWYAKRLEQSTPSFKKFSNFTPQNKVSKQETKESKIETKEKQLPAHTLVELKVAGKCFKCGEPWMPSHSKVCKAKQIYFVILVENEEGKEEVVVVEDVNSEEEVTSTKETDTLKACEISVQALTSTPTKVGTFTFKVNMHGHTAIALVDSGNDASFITSKLAIKSNCTISEVDTIQVSTAQGKTVFSSTTCSNCPYTIQGCSFTSDFRLFDIKGYDIILGADWLFSHSLVGLDLRKR